MTNICNNRELTLHGEFPRKDLRNWSSDQFLVGLGQLSTDKNLNIADTGVNLLKGPQDSVRSLIEHRRRFRVPKPLHPNFSVF